MFAKNPGKKRPGLRPWTVGVGANGCLVGIDRARFCASPGRTSSGRYGLPVATQMAIASARSAGMEVPGLAGR